MTNTRPESATELKTEAKTEIPVSVPSTLIKEEMDSVIGKLKTALSNYIKNNPNPLRVEEKSQGESLEVINPLFNSIQTAGDSRFLSEKLYELLCNAKPSDAKWVPTNILKLVAHLSGPFQQEIASAFSLKIWNDYINDKSSENTKKCIRNHVKNFEDYFIEWLQNKEKTQIDDVLHTIISSLCAQAKQHVPEILEWPLALPRSSRGKWLSCPSTTLLDIVFSHHCVKSIAEIKKQFEKEKLLTVPSIRELLVRHSANPEILRLVIDLIQSDVFNILCKNEEEIKDIPVPLLKLEGATDATPANISAALNNFITHMEDPLIRCLRYIADFKSSGSFSKDDSIYELIIKQLVTKENSHHDYAFAIEGLSYVYGARLKVLLKMIQAAQESFNKVSSNQNLSQQITTTLSSSSTSSSDLPKLSTSPFSLLSGKNVSVSSGSDTNTPAPSSFQP